MTRKEAALILRAIAMTEYRYEDEDEIMQMQDIKLKLMHIHPDQEAARERGHKMIVMLNRLLISLVALMLLSSLLIVYLYA
jgi:polysaccharide pyruvyl transferase WcaK-like protein